MEEGVTDTQEHTQGGEVERRHERTNGAGRGGGGTVVLLRRSRPTSSNLKATQSNVCHNSRTHNHFLTTTASLAAVPRAATGSWLTGCSPIRIVLRTESARAWQAAKPETQPLCPLVAGSRKTRTCWRMKRRKTKNFPSSSSAKDVLMFIEISRLV